MKNKIRLIDATGFENSIQLSIDSWSRDCNSNAPTIVRTYKDVLSRLKFAPTVDAAEVVRCNGCAFCSYNSSNDSYKCTSMNGIYRRVKPDDFCSYGERSGEDDCSKDAAAEDA